MEDLPPDQLARHLEVLGVDLRMMDPTGFFPWPLARLFNELLKESKAHLGEHPLLSAISSVKPHTNPDANPDVAAITVTTAAALVSHIHAALEMSLGLAYDT